MNGDQILGLYDAESGWMLWKAPWSLKGPNIAGDWFTAQWDSDEGQVMEPEDRQELVSTDEVRILHPVLLFPRLHHTFG